MFFFGEKSGNFRLDIDQFLIKEAQLSITFLVGHTIVFILFLGRIGAGASLSCSMLRHILATNKKQIYLPNAWVFLVKREVKSAWSGIRKWGYVCSGNRRCGYVVERRKLASASASAFLLLVLHESKFIIINKDNMLLIKYLN